MYVETAQMEINHDGKVVSVTVAFGQTLDLLNLPIESFGKGITGGPFEIRLDPLPIAVEGC